MHPIKMRLKKRKGVSPIVATTVLIGFTIAVTSIVLLFGGNILEDVQKKQGINLERTLQCDAMHFKVTGMSGGRIQVTNDGNEDIHAFLVRYMGSDAESIDSHHRVSIPQGGIGEIILSGGPGIGVLEKTKIYAKSAAGPKGNIIWGTCGDTETTVTIA